jgi:hypothetical protein
LQVRLRELHRLQVSLAVIVVPRSSDFICSTARLLVVFIFYRGIRSYIDISTALTVKEDLANSMSLGL